MVNCSRCNASLSAGSKFCHECGAQVPPEAASVGRPPDFSDLIAEKTRDFTGREWVFRRIERWLGDSAGERTFLLVGGPGTGKSAILARLAQFSRGQTAADGCPHLSANFLAYFHFCQARQDATLHPLRFVEALSQALASRHEPFAKALLESAQGDRHITINATQSVGTAADGSQVQNIVIQNLNLGNLSARVAFDRVVRRPLEALCRDGFRESIVVLVDSLDEAQTWREEENIVTLLADTLDDPRDLPAQVRFVMASRPDERVLGAVDLAPSLDLIADAPADAQEVSRYASARLAKAALDPEAADGLARRVAEASAGNFLYARYVLEDWLTRPGGVPLKNAEVDLPEGLRGIYRRFLKRELARDDEKWEDRYQSLLGLLAVARDEGLTLEHLAGASGRKRREVANAVRACAQYLTGTQPEGPFRIYHQSFRDYLLEETTYPIEPAEAHLALAENFLEENAGAWIRCRSRYVLGYSVYHLVEAIQGAQGNRARRELQTKLSGLLTDFGFLEAKVRVLSAFELLSDLRLGGSRVQPEEPQLALIRILEKILRFDGQFIHRHPGLLFQCCWNRGWWYDAPQAAAFLEAAEGSESTADPAWSRPGPKMHTFMEAWRAWREGSGSKAPWLRFLRPPPDPLNSPLTAVLLADDDSPRLAVSADGRRFVSGGSTGTVRLWDLSTGQLLAESALGEACYVGWIGFTPREDAIVVGSGDGSVRWLEPAGLREVRRLQASAEPISAALFVEGGRLLLTGDWKGQLQLWDIEQAREVAQVRAHDGEVTALVLIPDRAEVAVGVSNIGGPSVVGVWGIASAGLELIKAYHLPKRASVEAVLAWPDRRQLAWAENDDRITLLDLESAALRQLGRPTGNLPGCLAFLPGGRHLLHGSGDVQAGAAITCWDLDTGAALWQLEGHTGGITAMVVFDGGRRLLSSGANNDNTIRVWDLEQAAAGAIWSQTEADVTEVLFAAGGGLVCACSEKSELVFVRNLNDGKLVQRLSGHTGGVASAAVSPDGRLLACACAGGRVKVWDLPEGTEWAGLTLPKEIRQVAFSHDGRLLAGLTTKSVHLMDVAGRRIAAEFKAKAAAEFRLFGFSPDDRFLAALGEATWVWDLESAKPTPRQLEGFPLVYSVCFTEDNRHLVLEGPLEAVTAVSLESGAAVEADDRHRRAFALAKGRGPDGLHWHLPDPRPREGQSRADIEMTLMTPGGQAAAWLPFRYGKAYHHPDGCTWAVLREGQFFLLTLEDAEAGPLGPNPPP